MSVLASGTSFATTVNNGGSLTISSGGLDQFATINSGGSEAVFGSATSDTINNGGSQMLFGIEISATINSGGTVNQQSGAIEAGTTINSGAVEVVTAGLANNTNVPSGGSFIMATSGAGARVANGGTMIVSSGGNASDDVIDGTLIVGVGGSAGFESTFFERIDAGAVEVVSAGGSIGFTDVLGSLSVLPGGFASDTTVLNGGSAGIAGSGNVLRLDLPSRAFSGTGATAALTSGAIVSTVLMETGTLAVSAGATVGVALVDGGTMTVSSGGAITGSASGDLTVLSGGTVFSPGVQGPGAVLEIAGGAVVSGGLLFSSNGNGGRVRIDGTTMPTATISGWVNGDTVDLADVPFDPTGSAVVGSGNVQVTEGGATYALNLSLAQFYGTFHLSADAGSGTLITEDPVCFCRGTMILTDRGEVPVERLTVGDQVRTLSGRLKPIVWIGFGRSLLARANKLARPIVVEAGALADDAPSRDLYLTHGHALYFKDEDALIAVEHLVNHRSIRWDETARAVEYYHVELEGHEVVLANGAPAESYYDAGNRALFHNTRPGSMAGADRPTYAPVLTYGEVVESVWERLFSRCGGRPVTDSTDDPDLHLVADGLRREPTAMQGDVFTFALDRPPVSELLLRSRSGVPSLLGLSRADHRPLGIAITAIELENAGIATCLGHDTPQLREGGCYPPEDGFAWTDGEFAVPPRFFSGLHGGLTLTVHTINHRLMYPVLVGHRVQPPFLSGASPTGVDGGNG